MSFKTSGMITFRHTGDFKNTIKFLKKISEKAFLKKLESYAKMGVQALANATPKRTGKTAASWGYEISYGGDDISIIWTNSNINNGVNIAVILQYGHGTKNGGYVRGIDYINPAIQPIFEKMANDLWKEVIS